MVWGGVFLGEWATVADGKGPPVSALQAHRDTDRILILSDSLTAIGAALHISKGGKPRSHIERSLGKFLRERDRKGQDTSIITWVWGHIDIPAKPVLRV